MKAANAVIETDMMLSKRKCGARQTDRQTNAVGEGRVRVLMKCMREWIGWFLCKLGDNRDMMMLMRDIGRYAKVHTT